jgi:hypothetical protein
MTKNRVVSVSLTDAEMTAVRQRAEAELTDPGTWMRRVAISVANGAARVVAREREELGHAL